MSAGNVREAEGLAGVERDDRGFLWTDLPTHAFAKSPSENSGQAKGWGHPAHPLQNRQRVGHPGGHFVI
jgi:hypothetical protein